MDFNIPTHEFWKKIEVNDEYKSDHRHIYYRKEMLNDLGLEYLHTSFPTYTSDVIYFFFKVKNKRKFLLAKIKYGF